MFNWIRRRRLSADARRRLMLTSARAEEAIIETHVANLLDMLETLGDEIDFDRALEMYSEMMALDESRAVSVANRLMARLEEPSPQNSRKRRYQNVFRDEKD